MSRKKEKHRRIHYGNKDKVGLYVTYLCGPKKHHDRATFTTMSNHVTCPYCIELLKKSVVV